VLPAPLVHPKDGTERLLRKEGSADADPPRPTLPTAAWINNRTINTNTQKTN
jgi:hypothetical protein